MQKAEMQKQLPDLEVTGQILFIHIFSATTGNLRQNIVETPKTDLIYREKYEEYSIDVYALCRQYACC